MIVYRKTAGLAHDLRAEADDYAPKPGDIALPGWELPDIETLHDANAAANRAQQRMLSEKRAAALHALLLKQLDDAEADPRAPQAVRDYVAARGPK